MTAVSTEQLIVEDFCGIYSNLKTKEQQAGKKLLRKGSFDRICTDLFSRYQDYLNSIDLKDFRDFKALISKGLKARRDLKNKEVAVVLINDDNKKEQKDERPYWERMGFDQPLTMFNH